MRGTLRRYRLELLWVAFGIANYAARMTWPRWETVPLHFVWLGLTAICALRVWPVRPSSGAILALSMLAVGSLVVDALGVQLWSDVVEVPPLIAFLYLTLLWQARRRVEAHHVAANQAQQRSALLERQQLVMHDVSHELRTPVTIARGHLELLMRGTGDRRDVQIALEEMIRLDEAIGRLLLLATSDQDGFLVKSDIALEPFLEDVLMRWSGAAPRAWRLGPVAAGSLRADAERLRAALDALLENAVKYSPPGAAIELRARFTSPAGVSIEVEDEGFGVPAEALGRIFERFSRADTAYTRSVGGVGLGLAIVDAVAKRHEGRCTVTSGPDSTTFALELPEFTPAPDALAQLAEPALS
jgi:signal transduction histidine kinase